MNTRPTRPRTTAARHARTRRALRVALPVLAAVVSGLAAARDETVSLDGRFGSFLSLGDDRAAVQRLGPDAVDPQPADQDRVASEWIYFNSRGIRVRVCGDDDTVGTVNATVAPATRRYVTEAGVRIGDALERVQAVYGSRLETQAGSGGAVRFVDDTARGHRISFGFDAGGAMRWVALGALRDNGYTCGANPD